MPVAGDLTKDELLIGWDGMALRWGWGLIIGNVRFEGGGGEGEWDNLIMRGEGL